MSYAPSGGAATARQTRFPAWAFYGVLFGILGALSILAWGPIGVSGTYPRFIGELLTLVAPDYAAANPYLVKMGDLFAKTETYLVIGLLAGGFLGARLNREKAPACEMIHPSEKTPARRYRDVLHRRLPDRLRGAYRRRLHQRAHHLGDHAALRERVHLRGRGLRHRHLHRQDTQGSPSGDEGLSHDTDLCHARRDRDGVLHPARPRL